MLDAIAEYESSNLSYDEVCKKYDLNKPSFCYYLKKMRNKNKQEAEDKLKNDITQN